MAVIEGKKSTVISAETGVPLSTVKFWKSQFQQFFLEQVGWLKIFTRLFGKAVGVHEKYLDGKGELAGGDLQAAGRIFNMAGVGGAAVQVLNDNRKQVNVFPTIPVKADVDEQFAESAPVELKRMVRLLAPPAGETGAVS